MSVGSPGGEDGPPAALCGGSVDTGLWGIGDCGDEERGDGVAEGCPLGLDGVAEGCGGGGGVDGRSGGTGAVGVADGDGAGTDGDTVGVGVGFGVNCGTRSQALTRAVPVSG